MTKSRQLLIALSFWSLAPAQTPVANTNGIVNVASFALAGQPNGAIAPGSNSNIFGYQYGRMQRGTNAALKGFTASGMAFGYSFATLDAERLVDYQ